MSLALCRYAGSKAGHISILLNLMLSRLPAKPSRYITPTLGSGADLYAAIESDIPEYLASDLNQHLVAAHQVVKDDSDSLMRWLAGLESLSEDECKKLYYSWRATPDFESPIAQAGRFLYLIACGVNGIWRESKKSGYNIPFGKRFSFSPDRLRRCSEVLNKAQGQINTCDFADTLAQARPGDLIYLDPPFVDSTPMYLGPWKLDEHRRLFAAALNAKSLGANVFISNSDKPGTREIYQGRYHEIRVARTVEPGSKLKAAKRIPAQEVLIEI